MTSRENRIYLYDVNVIFYGCLNKKLTTRESMQETKPIVHPLYKSVQCFVYLHSVVINNGKSGLGYLIYLSERH